LNKQYLREKSSKNKGKNHLTRIKEFSLSGKNYLDFSLNTRREKNYNIF